MIVIGDIARGAGEDQRRAGPNRRFHVDGGGQFFPGDADQFGGVARLMRRIGDDHGDDVADMIGLVFRHHRIRLERRLGLIGVGDWSKAGQRPEIAEITGHEDAPDARRRARGFEVLDAEFRMPVWAAQKRRPELGALAGV